MGYIPGYLHARSDTGFVRKYGEGVQYMLGLVVYSLIDSFLTTYGRKGENSCSTHGHLLRGRVTMPRADASRGQAT